MLNDRDPNQEAPKSEEEGEYHFSDEDVSYELEDEEATTPEAGVSSAPPQSLKERILNRLNTSKRMLISLVVFLVLVFVVYKMVSPTASKAPSTDIKPTAAQVTNVGNMQATAPTNTTATAATTPPAAQTMPQPVTPAALPPAQTPVVETQPAASPTATPSTAGQPQVMQPGAAQPIASQATPVTLPPAAVTPPPQQAATQPTQATSPQQPVISMPQMIPIQAPEAAGSPVQPTGALSPAAAMSAQNAKMMNDLQAEYTQKLNDFANQNKNMGDEIQQLNTRVAGLEAQINQLAQQLTEKPHITSLRPEAAAGMTPPPNPPEPSAAPSHVAYTVQAIIPGRAWLRADNGETVTVTEGDMVRGLGRITKIDPYDGVVEITTGTKVISISYGSGT